MKTKSLIIAIMAFMVLSSIWTGAALCKVDKLDDAAVGTTASSTNPFFTYVLRDPVTDPEWQKTAQNEYTGPSGKKYIFDADNGYFGPAEGQGSSNAIWLPDQVKSVISNQPILSSIDYASLGIDKTHQLQYNYDANNKLVNIVDTTTGQTLIKIEYDGNNISYIKDLVNRQAIQYNTSGTFTSVSNYLVDRAGVRVTDTYTGNNPPYYYRTESTTCSNMLGKVTNVWMTDANGNILTGNNIVNGYSRGFAYFADGSPLVGQYGGFPTTTSSYGSSNWSSQNTTKQVALMEARYNTDGTIKDIRYNAWTSGTPGSGLEGQYAYRVDKFDSQGQRTTKWLNDPAPTHYEPTFSGTILKSDTGQYYMKVTSAFNDSGQDITSSYANKVYLLTTRFSTNPSDASGGQPNYDTSQNIASATGGGASRFTQGTNLTGQNAAAFAQAGWDGIVGSTVTVQGHLMTNPSASQKGLYYGGQSIGVFSAFDLR